MKCNYFVQCEGCCRLIMRFVPQCIMLRSRMASQNTSYMGCLVCMFWSGVVLSNHHEHPPAPSLLLSTGPVDLNMMSKCAPCLASPCQNNGTCISDVTGSYHCTCPFGYKVKELKVFSFQLFSLFLYMHTPFPQFIVRSLSELCISLQECTEKAYIINLPEPAQYIGSSSAHACTMLKQSMQKG